jgi:hypothetical protein
MIASCEEGDIVVPGLGAFGRLKLIALVLALDLCIVVLFIVYIYTQKCFIRIEARDFDDETVSITDFAIRVKHLPKPAVYRE